jgi:hypothetical protein
VENSAAFVNDPPFMSAPYPFRSSAEVCVCFLPHLFPDVGIFAHVPRAGWFDEIDAIPLAASRSATR